MSLEIRVLGPLQVQVDDAILRVDTRKALAIVALLAVDRRPYARDELAAMFWPEADDEAARSALRRTISVLKAALGDRWLRVDRSTVALAPHGDGVWLDLAALDESASRGDREGLDAAAALARGPFLAGFSLRDSPDFDDWRATRAVAVERQVLEVLDRLASAAEAAGDGAAAVTATTRLVELDPLDEPARRRLMAALARAGDRAGAIRQYRATVAVLERELGVAPLAQTTDLYEAIRDDRYEAPAATLEPPVAPATPRAAASATPLPMLGREPELALLAAGHRSAAAGGRVVTIEGEAGIGKSRLVEAALETAARQRAGTLLARAYPTEGTIPYAPIIELLRTGLGRPDAAARLAMVSPDALAEVARLVPLPPRVPAASATGAGDSPAARARLLDAIATVLAALVAGGVPGVIAVEDLQWADDASREALLYLARRLDARSLLLVLSWRTEDLDASGAAFAAAVEHLPGAAAIRLRRLAPADVAALVEAAIAAGLPAWDPAALASDSEGLPLYVIEALAGGPAALADAPPRGVRALMRERLAGLSEMASQVLAAGAVIGRSFDFVTVRAASGRSDEETVDALEELARRGLVRETAAGGEPTFDFGHARLRDAAYDQIGLARRRLLHHRVAEVLRAMPGRPTPGRLALIGGHERAAGRDREAAEAYLEAGLGSRRIHANREALGQLEAALALGHPDVARLQVAIGEARTALGDYAGAIAALEAAAAVSSDDGLPEIELRLGRVHARRGDVATAASHLDAALATADDRLRPEVLVERGAVALRAGDLTLAAALADEALRTLPSPGTDGARGSRKAGAANRLAGLVGLQRGDLAAARTALVRAVDAAEQGADLDPGALIAARNGLALVEAAAGDHGAAIALLEEALADCRRTGESHLEAAIENNLADQLHAAGRTDESMVHLKRAVALFAEVGGRPGELEPGIWQLVAW
jgi:DNA-binding SARP family transcriptional activator